MSGIRGSAWYWFEAKKREKLIQAYNAGALKK